MKLVLISLFLALAAGACTSPETERVRGGAPGADVRNRGEIVQMHEGSDPFYKTPQIISTQHAPIETANQANRLSRR